MVFRFWASLSLLVLACACRHNLICSLWAKGQLQIQGAIDESTWIKAETLNGKGSKNEPSVGLNSAYVMLHLSCRATEWIRRKRLCHPRQRRCIRKVPATERFDGSGNPSPTHQKNARTGHRFLFQMVSHQSLGRSRFGNPLPLPRECNNMPNKVKPSKHPSSLTFIQAVMIRGSMWGVG